MHHARQLDVGITIILMKKNCKSNVCRADGKKKKGKKMRSTKINIEYYRKMTWDWYAIPYVVNSALRNKKVKYWDGLDLKLCTKCENIYSINSNKGGGRSYQQFNYSNIPTRGVRKKTCYKCGGKNVTVLDY